MGLNGPESRRRLADWIRQRAGADSATISELQRLSGGAIQDNFELGVEIEGGPFEGRHTLVLRTDAPSGVAASLSRGQEFRVLEAAWRAKVKVPEPLWVCEDVDVLGAEFYLMRMVPGSASPRSLVRGQLTETEREALVQSLGAELAQIHRMQTPVEDLGFLQRPAASPALSRIERYRHYLDLLPRSRAVIEWALRWLERNAPSPGDELSLCHMDYRTGNFLVAEGKLTAILDWEFADWGDPMEDVGWFCARCWRFGAWEREAGGIGGRSAFYRGYESIAGQSLDHDRVVYWEVMAAVRWAIVALQQAERHISGGQASLELALTGRKLPEMELDMIMEIERIESGPFIHV